MELNFFSLIFSVYKEKKYNIFFFLGEFIGFVAESVARADSPVLPAGSSVISNSGSAQISNTFAQSGGITAFLPFILMFGVLYFLVLRPQQKKIKEQQQMLGGLKHGDEVVTASGIFGKLTGINDKVVTVEVADSVRIKVLKNQVSQVVKGSIKDIC